MVQHRDEYQVEPVKGGGIGRTIPIATFLLGIFLGAAVVKPWDLVFPVQPTASSQPGATSSTAGVSASPQPTPSKAPTECAFAGGWRVFALGQGDPLGGDGSTAGQTDPSSPPNRFADIANPLRRWLEVRPSDSPTQPESDRIPFVTIVSDQVRGIGYCPPPAGTDGPPADAELKAWSLDEHGLATALTLRPAALDPGTAVEVDVLIATGGEPTSGDRWAAGRYIFDIASAQDPQYGRWFGVEIRSPPGPPTDRPQP